MTTDFYFVTPVQLPDLLANLPEGVSIEPSVERKTWIADSGDIKGETLESVVLVGPSYSESNRCFLHVVAKKDGEILAFTRYNINKPTKMLELISAKLGVDIKDEFGFSLKETYFREQNG